jgi:hypothetical protein
VATFTFNSTGGTNQPGGGTGTQGADPAPEVVGTETVEVVTTVDDSGKAVSTVTMDDVRDAIDNAVAAVVEAREAGGTNIVAEIVIVAEVAAAPDTTISVSEINIPAAVIAAIADAGDIILTIESEVSTITLDVDTLAGLASGAAPDAVLKITAEIVEKETVLNERQLAVVGDNPVIELTLMIGSTVIREFDGTVTITKPYTPPESLEAADYDLLTVYFIDDDGNISEMRGMGFNVTAGTITFMTNHFSMFFVSEWISPFRDVARGDWFLRSVRFAFSNGLMVGTAEDVFAPSRNLTRAMVITILARQSGVDTTGGETWYSKAMAWGVENGITDGTNPSRDITREQFATILHRYASLGGQNVSNTGNLARFSDAEAVSDWAQEAMLWANARGLITGRTETTLAPRGNATRAEAATILMRFLST